MALSKLDALYMAVVADHSKHPHHQGYLDGVDPICLNNPSCGDVIKLFVSLEEGIIGAISFINSGCTISTASASMMTDIVLHQSRQKALDFAELFSQMVQGKPGNFEKELGDAAYLSGVAKFPQRIKCATLAWNALKKALNQEKGDRL